MDEVQVMLKCEMTVVFPSRPEFVHRARRLVHDQLTLLGMPDAVVDEAVTLMSELVTNAIMAQERDGLQPAPDVTARASFDGNVLELGVRDLASGLPEIRNPTDDETGGRGLRIVDEFGFKRRVERPCWPRRLWSHSGKEVIASKLIAAKAA